MYNIPISLTSNILHDITCSFAHIQVLYVNVIIDVTSMWDDGWGLVLVAVAAAAIGAASLPYFSKPFCVHCIYDCHNVLMGHCFDSEQIPTLDCFVVFCALELLNVPASSYAKISF